MANFTTVQKIQCDKWYADIGIILVISIYYIIIPICLFLGVLGQRTFLFVFYKQSKKESAYYYQVALSVNSFLFNFLFLGYWIDMVFFWNPRGNPTWSRQNFPFIGMLHF